MNCQALHINNDILGQAVSVKHYKVQSTCEKGQPASRLLKICLEMWHNLASTLQNTVLYKVSTPILCLLLFFSPLLI